MGDYTLIPEMVRIIEIAGVSTALAFTALLASRGIMKALDVLLSWIAGVMDRWT